MVLVVGGWGGRCLVCLGEGGGGRWAKFWDGYGVEGIGGRGMGGMVLGNDDAL